MPSKPLDLTDEEKALRMQRYREGYRRRLREQYWRDPEKARAARRARKNARRDAVNATWRASYSRRMSDAEYYEQYRTKRQQQRQRLKDRCYEAYGGYICRCCGETEPVFLVIDHVNDDGGKHRKEIGVGTRGLYFWLVKNNFPPGFQILCHNCNIAKSRGGCPHQIKLEQMVASLEVTLAVA